MRWQEIVLQASEYSLTPCDWFLAKRGTPPLKEIFTEAIIGTFSAGYLRYYFVEKDKNRFFCQLPEQLFEYKHLNYKNKARISKICMVCIKGSKRIPDSKTILQRFASFCISFIFSYRLFVEKKLVTIKHFLSSHLWSLKMGPFRLFSKYKQKLPFCHTFSPPKKVKKEMFNRHRFLFYK